LVGLFFKFSYLFEIIFKTASMKIHSPGLSLARLAVDLDKTIYCEPKNDFYKKS
jgi:hypothetical protein